MKSSEPKKQTSPVKAKPKKAVQNVANVLSNQPYSDSKIATMVKQGKTVKSKSNLKKSPKKHAPNVYDSDQKEGAYSEVGVQKQVQRDEARNSSASR